MTLFLWMIGSAIGVILACFAVALRKRIARLEAKVYRLEVEKMLRSPQPDTISLKDKKGAEVDA